jgi:hypothetical protein
MGIARVTLETDTSLVKAAMEGVEYRLSAVGGVITELRQLMMMEFVVCRVSVCPRSCNKVVHEMEAFGCVAAQVVFRSPRMMYLTLLRFWCPAILLRLMSNEIGFAFV